MVQIFSPLIYVRVAACIPRLMLALVLAFALATPADAQNASRPGSSARTNSGTPNRGTTSSRSATTTGTGRTATGQHQYRSNTELGDAIVTIDPETRSLIIVTDEDTHRELVKVIKTLDKPKPQVLIKVVFLEVTYNKDSDIGVEGSYTFNFKNPVAATTGTSTTTTNATTTTPGATATSPTSSTSVNTVLNGTIGSAASAGQTLGLSSLFGLASATNGSFLRLASDDWSATVRLLQTKGKVEVLSRPSIMARNNQEAVIVVGQEVPFITNSRVDSLGQTINTIQYDNIGIILRVTPFITSENTVEMIVAPEISALTDQTVPISNTVSSPVIAKRSAETVVVVPNAQTVVIGGLMQTQRIENIQKIPLLGDIPFFGFPFRRTIKSDQKKELMIFLTPYIVNNPEGLLKATNNELDRTELAEKAFSDREFNRYLDTPLLYPDSEEQVEGKEIRRATVVETPDASTTVTKQTTTTTRSAKPVPKLNR